MSNNLLTITANGSPTNAWSHSIECYTRIGLSNTAVECGGENWPQISASWMNQTMISWHSTRLPERIGRYQIRKILGRGGMGAVYLVHDAELDRLVAMRGSARIC
jgi:serine/threonine-protein kinase